MIAEEQGFVTSRSGDCVRRLDPVRANDIGERSFGRLQLPLRNLTCTGLMASPDKSADGSMTKKERVVFSKITVRSILSGVITF